MLSTFAAFLPFPHLGDARNRDCGKGSGDGGLRRKILITYLRLLMCSLR